MVNQTGLNQVQSAERARHVLWMEKYGMRWRGREPIVAEEASLYDLPFLLQRPRSLLLPSDDNFAPPTHVVVGRRSSSRRFAAVCRLPTAMTHFYEDTRRYSRLLIDKKETGRTLTEFVHPACTRLSIRSIQSNCTQSIEYDLLRIQKPSSRIKQEIKSTARS